MGGFFHNKCSAMNSQKGVSLVTLSSQEMLSIDPQHFMQTVTAAASSRQQQPYPATKTGFNHNGSVKNSFAHPLFRAVVLNLGSKGSPQTLGKQADLLCDS